MWEVSESMWNSQARRWYVGRRKGEVFDSVWPPGVDLRTGYVDEGTAILMCDVLNARDYPDVAG